MADPVTYKGPLVLTANNQLGFNNRAGLLSLLGDVSSASLFTPRVVYVRTNGDDDAAVIGDPTRPFRTGDAAYTAADAVALGDGSTVVMDWGAGVFSVTRRGQTLNAYVTHRGQGRRVSRTSFDLDGRDGVNDVFDENSQPLSFATPGGNGGATSFLDASNMTISVSVNAGSGGYNSFNLQLPGGDAGSAEVNLSGDALLYLSGTNGSGMPFGSGGSFTVHGGRLDASISASGSSSYLRLDEVFVQNLAGNGTLVAANSNFTYTGYDGGFQITDLGGNSFD